MEETVITNQWINSWLRSDYGLDDDILNAGEVEEMLQSFVVDYNKYKNMGVTD